MVWCLLLLDVMVILLMAVDFSLGVLLVVPEEVSIQILGVDAGGLSMGGHPVVRNVFNSSSHRALFSLRCALSSSRTRALSALSSLCFALSLLLSVPSILVFYLLYLLRAVLSLLPIFLLVPVGMSFKYCYSNWWCWHFGYWIYQHPQHLQTQLYLHTQFVKSCYQYYHNNYYPFSKWFVDDIHLHSRIVIWYFFDIIVGIVCTYNGGWHVCRTDRTSGWIGFVFNNRLHMCLFWLSSYFWWSHLLLLLLLLVCVIVWDNRYLLIFWLCVCVVLVGRIGSKIELSIAAANISYSLIGQATSSALSSAA